MSSPHGRESQVRRYSRVWPAVFDTASGSRLHATDGTAYLDFFAGAGALNYGHNNPRLKQALLRYLEQDRVVHGLDMFTMAREDLLDTLDTLVLRPRRLDHMVVFPGPGGANAVEAALKLARKVTHRQLVVHFSNAFHGMTLGALSVAGTAANRRAAGVPLPHTIALPYDDPAALERLCDLAPAAVIVETVQGEGGLDAADGAWLRSLAERCRQAGALLISDDVQTGCGRTGPFFSTEDVGIVPDMFCLSKSVSGYGLPMALLLVRPELDAWQPGEHSSTFRGFNPAFVTGAAALRTYWSVRQRRARRPCRRRGVRAAPAGGDLGARRRGGEAAAAADGDRHRTRRGARHRSPGGDVPRPKRGPADGVNTRSASSGRRRAPVARSRGARFPRQPLLEALDGVSGLQPG